MEERFLQQKGQWEQSTAVRLHQSDDLLFQNNTRWKLDSNSVHCTFDWLKIFFFLLQTVMPAFPLSSESFVKDLPCVLPPIISPLSCAVPPIASHLSYFPPFSHLSLSRICRHTHLKGILCKMICVSKENTRCHFSGSRTIMVFVLWMPPVLPCQPFRWLLPVC